MPAASSYPELQCMLEGRQSSCKLDHSLPEPLNTPVVIPPWHRSQ